MRMLIVIATASLVVGSVPALAQSNTALQAGRYWAQKRGAPDINCYARVFARHAVVVEKLRGGREWYAPATVAYNADMQRSCGIDRMALVRSQRNRQAIVGNQRGGTTHVVQRVNSGNGVWQPPAQPQRQVAVLPSQASAQRAGYGLGVREQVSDPGCFARVYARHAHAINDPNGRVSGGWYGVPGNNPSFSRELWSECRIAR